MINIQLIDNPVALLFQIKRNNLSSVEPHRGTQPTRNKNLLNMKNWMGIHYSVSLKWKH
jgi:hypothetical protein